MLQFMAECFGLFDTIFFALWDVDFFMYLIGLLILQMMFGVFLMGLGRSTRRAKL